MKKFWLASFVVMISLSASQIYAQSPSFGVKAGANLSNHLLSDLDGVKSKMGVGAQVGVFAAFDLADYFTLQPEVQLQWNNSELTYNGSKGDFSYWGISVPVYALARFEQENGERATFGVGPFAEVGLSAQAKAGGTEYDLYDGSDFLGSKLQRFDAGLAATVGYEFDFGLSVHGSYKLGLVNALDEGSGKLRNQQVSLQLGYRF
ncbi:porin family protein [Limibacterium fermenti]|uniref:porin family protein n=1 Tax=Limibacterium fermenti TaxID=3229863 RepID=UPI000E7FC942|nr:hypothetical protein [Porphyromonadaceae bacterium]